MTLQNLENPYVMTIKSIFEATAQFAGKIGDSHDLPTRSKTEKHQKTAAEHTKTIDLAYRTSKINNLKIARKANNCDNRNMDPTSPILATCNNHRTKNLQKYTTRLRRSD